MRYRPDFAMHSARTALVLAMVAGTPAIGQSPVPVGFVPGLAETPGIWYGSAPSLASSFNISPFYPDPPTTFTLAAQLAALGTVGANSYLVGHSAGGVLARLYAQSQRPLAGIVTLGTPNYGAPILTNYPGFCEFVGGTVLDGVFLSLSLVPQIDQWIIHNIEPDYDLAVTLLGGLCDAIADAFAGTNTPAAADLTIYSGAIAALNAPANVAVEQANAGTEVSVVVTT